MQLPLAAQILQGAPAGEVKARLAASCAPTSSQGVAGGAWDAPSPQTVPKLHCLAPRASAETAGRHGHPELDVTKPRLGAESSSTVAPSASTLSCLGHGPKGFGPRRRRPALPFSAARPR